MATFNLSKNILYDFWAPWCGPCYKMNPVIEALQEERRDLIVKKINVDENQKLKTKFNIKSIPTLILVDENENELKRLSGVASLNEIRSHFEI